jgi:maleamate amidohydrolase
MASSERVWDRFLTDRDRQVFAAAGYGQPAGFRDRPALVVVDINYNFVGDHPEPILDSIRRFRNSCGAEGWAAMERLQPVLAAARRKGIPVIYSTGDDGHELLDRASWGAKNRRVGQAPAGTTVAGNAIPDPIAPLPHEIVLPKKKPSVFVGTPLLQYLVANDVNQLLVCGTTTSGCVRATVVDAFSFNYRVAVIEDCTFDRGEASHAINLFDMQQKYADVVSAAEVVAYLEGLPDHCFPLWEERAALKR